MTETRETEDHMAARESSHAGGVKLELEGLLARVEGAAGPDRELDKALWYKLIFDPALDRQDDSYLKLVGSPLPWFTASLDAALALVERRLPTFTTDLTIYRTNAGEFKPHSLARLFCPYGEISEYRGDAKTPALALLAALLRALITQAQPSQTGESGEGKGEGR